MQQFRETQYVLLIDSFLFSSGVCHIHSALLPKYFPKAAFPTPAIPVRKQEERLQKEAQQRAPDQSRSPFCTARTEQTPSLSSTKATDEGAIGFSYTKKTMKTILLHLCRIFPKTPLSHPTRRPRVCSCVRHSRAARQCPSTMTKQSVAVSSHFSILYIFRLSSWEKCVKSLFLIIFQ